MTGSAWFTAAELAELALPGLPRTKRKVNELASENGWALRTDTAGAPLARPRQARGGGLEYSRSLLPAPAALELARRGFGATDAPARTGSGWAWLEAQPEAVRTEARERLAAIGAVEELERAGLTATAAVASTAARLEVSCATLWSWRKLAFGVAPEDRLPAIAPRRKGGGAEAEIHAEAWRAFKSDYLRPEKPTLAACYARLQLAAADRGWGGLPHVKSLQRKLDRELDPRVVTLAREGVEALRRRLPPQTRTVAELHALEHVNIDGHRWDVFVRWPDGRIARPMMVAIQDIYSRKMLSWRIAPSESADTVRLCFADLFRTWGVPRACTLDNGRGFASKWITGGTANRYRFKVQPGDPVGLLTGLGVAVHWATPYRGQSKPIERAFRDLCDHGAKHPAFAGAYTGNKPDAKPDNYGSKAVPLETFRKVVGAVIAAHNARAGRQTEMAKATGQSFDQVFDASYAVSPIARATPEQLRLALLAADKVTADRKSGAVRLFDNAYWAPALGDHAGQSVVVRFDPDDLHAGVAVYDLAGRFITEAALWAATGFSDTGAARERAKLEAGHRKAARDALKAEQLLTAAELAALLPSEPPEAEPVSPIVIRPVRLGGATAAALKPQARPALIDRLESVFPDPQPAAERPMLRLVE